MSCLLCLCVCVYVVISGQLRVGHSTCTGMLLPLKTFRPVKTFHPHQPTASHQPLADYDLCELDRLLPLKLIRLAGGRQSTVSSSLGRLGTYLPLHCCCCRYGSGILWIARHSGVRFMIAYIQRWCVTCCQSWFILRWRCLLSADDNEHVWLPEMCT